MLHNVNSTYYPMNTTPLSSTATPYGPYGYMNTKLDTSYYQNRQNFPSNTITNTNTANMTATRDLLLPTPTHSSHSVHHSQNNGHGHRGPRKQNGSFGFNLAHQQQVKQQNEKQVKTLQMQQMEREIGSQHRGKGKGRKDVGNDEDGDEDYHEETSHNSQSHSRSSSETKTKRPNPNKSKEARRRLRQILDVVCARYHTSVEQCRCAMKNNRKVTYLLSYGEVDHLSCFIRERGDEVILIPNGYIVCFEANSNVWIGRILYKTRTYDGLPPTSNDLLHDISCGAIGSGMGSDEVAHFEVVPVNEKGIELYEFSSGYQENMSCAFKTALAKMKDHFGSDSRFEKASSRPNGRLYIGVYYESVQEKLRGWFREKLQAGVMNNVSTELMQRLQWWLSLSSKMSRATGGKTSATEQRNSKTFGGTVGSGSHFVVGDGKVQAKHSNSMSSTNSLGSVDSHVRGLNLNSHGQGYSKPFLNATKNYDDNLYGYQNREYASSKDTPAVESRSPPPLHPMTSQISFDIDVINLLSQGNNGQGFGNGYFPLSSNTLLNNSSFPQNGELINQWYQNHVRVPTSEFEISRDLNEPAPDNTGRKSDIPNDYNCHDPSGSQTQQELPAAVERRLSLKKRGSEYSLNELVDMVEKPNKAPMETELTEAFDKVLLQQYNPAKNQGETVNEFIKALGNIQERLAHQTEKKQKKLYGNGSKDRPTLVTIHEDSVGDIPSLGELEKTVSQRSFVEMFNFVENGNNGFGREKFSFSDRDFEAAYLNSNDIDHIDLSALFDREPQGVAASSNQADTDAGKPVPNIVACNMTPEALYLTLDVKNEKNIGEKEINNALKCLRIPITSSIVRKTYEACDKNGDGQVSMEEFIQYLREREKELRVMFDKIDVSGDGFVSLDELKLARERGMFRASDEEIENFLTWMDSIKNGRKDGQIDFEEFRTNMILFPPATTIQEIIDIMRNRPEQTVTSRT